MLKRLTVSNMAIIERAEVEFDPGLNVITGETGSGKSVLMGALELVLGARADSGVVREGAKEAEVEAEFGDGTILRRTVSASGRTRAWMNDESVGLAELKEAGAGLVDIHGPRANQALLEEAFQRETLDGFAGSGGEDAARRYAAAYGEMKALDAEIAALEASASGDIAGEIDMLRYQVEELAAADLSEDDEDLAERHAAAAHAQDVIEEANAITDGLGGDQGAAEALIRLQPRFAALSRRMPEAEAWAHEADELTVRLQELSRTVADAVSRIDIGEASLAELDARLTTVNRLERKYRVAHVADLMALLEKKRTRLDDLQGRDEKIAALTARLSTARAEVVRTGADLTRRRQAAASHLAKAVTTQLRDLGFLQAKFSVTLAACEPEAHGCDRVAYLFEPNPGEPARPLAAIASSGEIARVMLAVKVALQGRETGPRGGQTLVFDEIDANIGGEVGRVVGEKMRAVAERHQVVAITHLPQCAACGQRHLVVSKGVSGGRTRTLVRSVTGEERILEIARMLGGGSTGVARRHAEEMIETEEG